MKNERLFHNLTFCAQAQFGIGDRNQSTKDEDTKHPK
jgi:hypothetical protein